MILYLRSVDPAVNRRRHYLVTVQENLFGETVVSRHWGRIGYPWQGDRQTVVSGPRRARKVLGEVLARRRAHGYQVVPCSL